jgi:uncharacterized protein (DUF2141 family)
MGFPYEAYRLGRAFALTLFGADNMSVRWFSVGSLLLIALSVAGCMRKAEFHANSDVTIAPATQPLARLTVRVIDLRNHKGQLIFGVFKSADGFPEEPKKSVNWQVKTIDGDAVVFTVLLPPGKYAASVLHDENKNNKMDMSFLGIPEEGYGMTNNPKPEYREARFPEALFDLPAGGATITISMQYF